MKDSSYWIKKVKSLRNKKVHKCAEKILIGYENPKVKFKYVVMYRTLEKLGSYYPKPIMTDSQGFRVGILRERVYDDMQTCITVIKDFLDAGWVFEQGDPVFVKKIEENGVDLNNAE